MFLRFKCGEEADLSNIPTIISVKDVENSLNDLGRSILREKSNLYRAYHMTLPLLLLFVADAKVSFENRKTSLIPPIHIRDLTDLDAERRIVQTLKLTRKNAVND